MIFITSGLRKTVAKIAVFIKVILVVLLISLFTLPIASLVWRV